MKTKIVLLMVLLLLLQSCQKNGTDISIAGEYNILSIHTTLKDKSGNKEYYFKNIANIFSFGDDSLVVIPQDEKKVYITDNDLNVLDVHDFENCDFLIKLPVYGTALYNKELYFIDITFQIKKYNFYSRMITSLPAANRGNGSFYVYNDSVSVTTEQSPEYPTFVSNNGKPEKVDSKILAGIITKGKDFKGIPLYVDKDIYSQIDFVKSEKAYVNIFKDKIYIIFMISKKVLIYDLSGKFLKVTDIIVNDDFYHSPSSKMVNGRQWYFFASLTAQAFGTDNGNLTYMVRNKAGNNREIIYFDEEVQPVRKYILNNSNRSEETYINCFWLCNKRVYTTSGFNGITIYK